VFELKERDTADISGIVILRTHLTLASLSKQAALSHKTIFLADEVGQN
jgi:hypothetical protein